MRWIANPIEASASLAVSSNQYCVSSIGRALACHARGNGIETRTLCQNTRSDGQSLAFEADREGFESSTGCQAEPNAVIAQLNRKIIPSNVRIGSLF